MYRIDGAPPSRTAIASGAMMMPCLEYEVSFSYAKLLRRWGFALGAATILASVLASPAAASAGKVPVGRRHRVVHTSPKHVHVSRLKHDRRALAQHVRSHHGTASAIPARMLVAPLVNTVWDNTAMSPVVLEAILAAAGKSEIAPDLLVALAWRESRFAPAAQSRLSSATGLLQFTSGTWLQAVHQFGSQHGVPEYAASIHKSRSGEYTVEGRYTREEVLALRNDPVLSASMAAEVLGTQRTAIQASIGRNTTPTDLYLIHVLGSRGTARFLTALNQGPSAPVLKVASRKVLRNAGLLARDGRPMTIAGTYKAIQAMLDDQRTHFEPVVAVASKKDLP